MSFLPSKEYQDRWVPVTVCRSCRGVVSVTTSITESGGIPTWTDVSGDSELPCPTCGHYAAVKELSPKRLRVAHVVVAVARYNTPARAWWNPWTWGLEGEWEVRPEAVVKPKPTGPPPQKKPPMPEA